MQPHIALSSFDADAFGIPYYRVHRIDPASIEQEVRSLRETAGGLIIDAKIPAEDVENTRLLGLLGFRKVCVQITLRHDLKTPGTPSSSAAATARLDLPESVIQQHAANFVFDRFSLDPLLPREGTRRLYANWVRNSLTSGRKQIIHIGSNFCTLAVHDGRATIDLVSVLDQGQGIGRRLVDGALDYARIQGAGELLVTTECENARAWNLYLRAGCVPAKFTSAFHFVQR